MLTGLTPSSLAMSAMAENGSARVWMACYGTLRRQSLYARAGHRVGAGMHFWGYGLARGRLHWQRTYPALVAGPGLVQVQIYRISDPGVLAYLDAYEGYDPDRPARSLFLRRLTTLFRPRLRAWTYHLNPSIRPGALMDS